MAIYLDKEKIFCIHCKSECQIRQTEDRINTNFTYPSSNYAVVNQAPQKQLVLLPIEKETAKDNSRFCYNCGTELSDRAGQYCYLCGASIK